MADDTEAKVVGSYRCRHCRSALVDRTAGENAWLRCPKCGRGSRPPLGEGAACLQEANAPRRDLVFLDAKGAAKPIATGGAWRAGFASALFVAVTMLLFAVLEGSANGVTVCAGVAVVALGMLIRSTRS